MWRKLVSLVLLASVLSVTTSCAAIFHGTSETLHVRSEESGTSFFLNERDIGTGTSAITTIPKKQLGRATLRAVKEGCNDRSVPVAGEFDAITLLGLLIDFGIISILVVDWGATGAINRAAQTDFVLTPECPQNTLSVATPHEYHLSAVLEGIR